MKNCKHCTINKLVKKGKRGFIERYQCKDCDKYQQDVYRYKLWGCFSMYCHYIFNFVVLSSFQDLFFLYIYDLLSY